MGIVHLLLVVLVIMLILGALPLGGNPNGPYWGTGYLGGGGIGLVLVILLVLLLAGRL